MHWMMGISNSQSPNFCQKKGGGRAFFFTYSKHILKYEFLRLCMILHGISHLFNWQYSYPCLGLQGAMLRWPPCITEQLASAFSGALASCSVRARGSKMTFQAVHMIVKCKNMSFTPPLLCHLNKVFLHYYFFFVFHE